MSLTIKKNDDNEFWLYYTTEYNNIEIILNNNNDIYKKNFEINEIIILLQNEFNNCNEDCNEYYYGIISFSIVKKECCVAFDSYNYDDNYHTKIKLYFTITNEIITVFKNFKEELK